MDIENLTSAIREARVRITDHADEEAADDNLSYKEIYFSVMHGEVIEDYPKDKPYPSCLVLGRNFSGEPIHSVWAYNPKNSWAVLITVYRPDPLRWIGGKVRMRK
uniref:DUF4258 domain-containing protein n=1 Tax=Candidatus Kentrum sp. DK TaxID=2126562 RepID=A0A450RT94_9GAMM|nr:MAG: protein of unknown function (DUF4258) [Candidatus Kentron sp. DK]